MRLKARMGTLLVTNGLFNNNNKQEVHTLWSPEPMKVGALQYGT